MQLSTSVDNALVVPFVQRVIKVASAINNRAFDYTHTEAAYRSLSVLCGYYLHIPSKSRALTSVTPIVYT
jgi:hypothetical protein